MPVYTASAFQRILEFVQKERAARIEDVAIGKPKSWDDYVRDVSYIKAMMDVEEEMRAITGNQEALEEKDMA